jgi:hypothetical protein
LNGFERSETIAIIELGVAFEPSPGACHGLGGRRSLVDAVAGTNHVRSLADAGLDRARGEQDARSQGKRGNQPTQGGGDIGHGTHALSLDADTTNNTLPPQQHTAACNLAIASLPQYG